MAKIWDRQSYGLYDYTNKNKNIISQEIFLSKDAELLCMKRQLKIVCVKSKDFKQQSLLIKRLSINFGNRNIEFVGNGPSISDHLWLRVINNKDVAVMQNDMIRIGKIVLLI